MPHPQKYSKVIPKALVATPESIQSTATAQPSQQEEVKLESKFKQLLEEEGKSGPLTSQPSG
jgi:hypothetical protein